jgi:hypothetical protein
VNYQAGMVSNGGFENGTQAWSGFGNSVAIDNTVFAAGAGSAKVTADGSGERSIQQDIRVYSGVFYNLAAYVRTGGATTAARVAWLSSSGQVLGTMEMVAVSGNTDWKVITAGDFAPPSAYTARIILGTAAGSGSASYDEVGFFSGPAPVQPPPVNPPPVNPPTDPPPANVSYGAGMAVNGGFENGTDGWQGFGSATTIDSSVFAAGSDSAKIAAGGGENSVQQDIRVYSGVFYTLAAYVKTAGATSAPRIVWLDSNGQVLGTTVLGPVSGNTDWRVTAAGDFAPPAAYTARIVLAAAPGSGSLWYDQVGFFPGRLPGGTPTTGTTPPPSTPPPSGSTVTPPSNYNAGMVGNGNFEAGTQPWDGLGSNDGTLDSNVYLEGENSAKVAATSSERSIEQTVEVYSGVSYTMSVFVQTAGATSVARIDWLDINGQFLSSTMLPEVSGNTSWKQIKVTAFGPPSARQARIVLGTAPGSGSAWFDAVSFTN